jgi:hypothetical protein
MRTHPANATADSLAHTSTISLPPLPNTDKPTTHELPQSSERPKRSLSYLARQIVTPALLADTGLENLPLRDFLELARARRAFFHATETPLRAGWWSSLLDRPFLQNRESAPFKRYLADHVREHTVVEIGPGEQIARHAKVMRSRFGASHYLSCDLNRDSERQGAVITDALSFFSLIDNDAVSAIMAFGVFNEPMSLQFPAHNPPRFYLPARGPEDATRAHCEHEYVRRLAREMIRVLKPGGVLLGDGLHSRGFEQEVQRYLLLAGFVEDSEGWASLERVQRHVFRIIDPFFLKKQEA